MIYIISSGFYLFLYLLYKEKKLFANLYIYIINKLYILIFKFNKLHIFIHLLSITCIIYNGLEIGVCFMDEIPSDNASNGTDNSTPSLSNTNGSSVVSDDTPSINRGLHSAWSPTTSSETTSSSNILPRSTGYYNLNEFARWTELQNSNSSSFPRQNISENSQDLPNSYSENYLDPIKDKKNK